VIWPLLAAGAAAAAYQALALIGALRHRARGDGAGSWLPPVSILKPVRGLEDGFEEAIRSHAVLDYPEYEVLFGVADPADPGVHAIERLAREFPHVRLVNCRTAAPNGKVGVLADLAAAARNPILLVNDSDIRVPRDYLRRVVPPLADETAGMVTCLYRARSATWPGRLEALGIATDFAPSVLVAPLFGVSEFALGSTMVFRAKDLARAGGFAAIADYIADDYQLSRRIRSLGLKVHMARCVVETSLPDAGWASVWRHQVRWARTIRVSRGDGYIGLPVTFATLWSMALAAAGGWGFAAGLLGLRMAAGIAGCLAMEDRESLRLTWLIPVRDLAGVAVWAAGLFGNWVVWRDRRLRLGRDGRIA
jgi:ceramide glucosyltransferase